MAGNSSRNKGQSGEREVMGILKLIVEERYKTLTNLDCPVLERNLNQSNKGGYDIIGLDWLALEVKRQETLLIDQWWAQTKKQAKHNQHPVLIYRASRQPWRVMLEVSIYENNQLLIMPAQISLDYFLKWFKLKLTSKLIADLPKPN